MDLRKVDDTEVHAEHPTLARSFEGDHERAERAFARIEPEVWRETGRHARRIDGEGTGLALVRVQLAASDREHRDPECVLDVGDGQQRARVAERPDLLDATDRIVIVASGVAVAARPASLGDAVEDGPGATEAPWASRPVREPPSSNSMGPEG